MIRFVTYFSTLIFFILRASCNYVSGQDLSCTPQQVRIKDRNLTDVILKYKKNLGKKDVMIVGVTQHMDSTKYYISMIRSLFVLSKHIPVAYAKVSNVYIILYTGLEKVVHFSKKDKTQFLSFFKTKLDNDLLADQKTQHPNAFGSGYDPIQVLVIVKNNEVVYDDYRKGFGGTGFPFFYGK